MNQQKADDIPLIPMGQFGTAIKKVLQTTKEESDAELRRFQERMKKRAVEKRRSAK